MNSTLVNASFSDDDNERSVYLKYAPTYIYCMYLIIFWLAIGSVGNILSCLVWISPRVRKENSSAVYLAALSVADLCLLVFTLLVHLHYMFAMQPVTLVPVICEMYNVPYLAAQYLSPLLVLAFTIERWIAICFPFKRDTLCTTGRACIVVAGLVIFTLCLSGIPASMFKYKFIDGRDHCEQDRENTVIQTIVIVTDLMMSGGVPLLTLVCNILVIRELRMIDRRNKSLRVALVDRTGSPSRPSSAGISGGGDAAAGGNNFKATTAMLLSVSFFLIFTTLPAGLVYTLQFTITQGSTNVSFDSPSWQPFFRLVTAKAIIDQVALSHYALNFFIYLFTGKVFRRHLQRQLMRFRFVRFLILKCGCQRMDERRETIVYSAVRHSLHPDNAGRIGNGSSRRSVATLPLGASNRRQSARNTSCVTTSIPSNSSEDDRKNGDLAHEFKPSGQHLSLPT